MHLAGDESRGIPQLQRGRGGGGKLTLICPRTLPPLTADHPLPRAGAPKMTPPTLYIMVGLPGAGKTTLVKRLEQEHSALRLTPDEWMMPLFG